MGLILLVPGLVLLLVNAQWFDGQHQVGQILTIIGVALIVLQIMWTIAGVMLAKSMMSKRPRGRW